MSLELTDFALCHFYISLRKRPLSDYIDSIISNLHHKPSTLKKKRTQSELGLLPTSRRWTTVQMECNDESLG